MDVPFVLAEVHRRMLGRAEILRLPPGPVLFHGHYHADLLAPLQNQFPQSPLVALTPMVVPLPSNVPGVQAGSGLMQSVQAVLSRFMVSKPAAITGLAPISGPLPVVDGQAALVWSPLMLHGAANPEQLVVSWQRALGEQGAVFFSAFGPDTAIELQALAKALGQPSPDFPDMHDLGDLLARSGFADPVMEMEKLTLTYATPQALLADWRALQGNSLQKRRSGLLGRAAHQELLALLEAQRNSQTGRLSLTLELVYGHAWKVGRKPARGPAGEAFVPLDQIGRKPPPR